jgi:uncharacterized membrane protein YhfC
MTPPELPTIRVSFVLTSVLVQWPLMIGMPIALGLWLRRRLGVPLGVWGLGMATFVVSQVVHIPLNMGLGLLGRPGPLSAASWPVLAASLGLSAGLCEELARYAAMRLLLKAHTTRHAAVMFGAGHGGIEALIFGVMVAANLLFMLLLPALGDLGARPEIQAAAWSYWLHGWTEPIYAGVERVAAVMSHIGLSVLVMRSIQRRNVLWLLAAIVLHSVLDGMLIPLQRTGIDVGWVELIVLGFGVVLLGATLVPRERASSTHPSRA